MKVSSRRLGQVRKAIAWVQMYNKQIVRTGELKNAMALSAEQESDLFKYLKRKGLFIQLQRGMYLAPLKMPPGGWMPSPYKIIAIYMKELKAQYQITGLYAFNRYGFSTQVPMEMALYNTRLSKRKKIGNLYFEFIKVDSSRLGGTELISIENEGFDKPLQIAVGSKARTIFDAIYDYKRFGTLPEAYDWIKAQRDDKALIKSLIDITVQYGNVGTRRRIGFWLSQLGIPGAKKILKTLPKTQSWALLVPNKKAVGKTNKEWGIIINDNQ